MPATPGGTSIVLRTGVQPRVPVQPPIAGAALELLAGRIDEIGHDPRVEPLLRAGLDALGLHLARKEHGLGVLREEARRVDHAHLPGALEGDLEVALALGYEVVGRGGEGQLGGARAGQ